MRPAARPPHAVVHLALLLPALHRVDDGSCCGMCRSRHALLLQPSGQDGRAEPDGHRGEAGGPVPRPVCDDRQRQKYAEAAGCLRPRVELARPGGLGQEKVLAVGWVRCRPARRWLHAVGHGAAGVPRMPAQ